jgi:hypothetical protein
MAKISARGAVKLAEATSDYTAEDNDGLQGVGGIVRTFYVLRSDGTVLAASSFPNHPGGSYDRKRSTYKAVARMSKDIGREGMLAAFGRFAARKGATLV